MVLRLFFLFQGHLPLRKEMIGHAIKAITYSFYIFRFLNNTIHSIRFRHDASHHSGPG